MKNSKFKSETNTDSRGQNRNHALIPGKQNGPLASGVSEAEIEDSYVNDRGVVQGGISSGHAYRKEESKSVKAINLKNETRNPNENRSSAMGSNFSEG